MGTGPPTRCWKAGSDPGIPWRNKTLRGSFRVYLVIEGMLSMIKLALISLVIAAVLALLGFGGAAGTFVGIAKLLFGVAIVLFLIFLVLGIMAGRGVKDAID
ncbi:hypothetical protein SCLO_1008270 [Sphingobium cloacae]|uniref:UPF0391 membrane protein SCLO_1008270 n=2 Tax=Sphingobium cloacae TaxID=120107 RepID=A0A1E1F014_9SPHN|nr:hypothetical protein SCLO_1008270 [Sphingobium cloacae]